MSHHIGVDPPEVGVARRVRFIYDFFLTTERPNGSNIAAAITDEITITLAGNPGKLNTSAILMGGTTNLIMTTTTATTTTTRRRRRRIAMSW